MRARYGSGENWQYEMTKIWIQRMISEYSDKKVIIFEGQVNLDFIKEGFAECDFSNYKIVLVDCNEETMNFRLREKRMQPELVTSEMNNWRKFLRTKALKYGESIIKTDELDIGQTVQAFESILKHAKVELK